MRLDRGPSSINGTVGAGERISRAQGSPWITARSARKIAPQLKTVKAIRPPGSVERQPLGFVEVLDTVLSADGQQIGRTGGQLLHQALDTGRCEEDEHACHLLRVVLEVVHDATWDV